MKKTLIASAVAAATLSTGVMAADKGVDIYGNIQVVYVNQEVGDNSTNDVQDTGSTIGFKHSHMISEGVTAFAKAEFEFDADEDISGIDQSDEIYVGVKGDFGSIQYGVDDGIVEWTDVVDISEAVSYTHLTLPTTPYV